MPFLVPVLAVTLAVAGGLLASWLVRRVVLRLNRNKPALRETSRVARLPLRFALCLIGVRIALGLTTDDAEWRRNVDHALQIALIGSLAWLAIAVILIVETMVLTRYRVDVADNRRARRLRTQVILARRIGVALIVIVALGIAMLTFPAIQALGAGLLASAGVISIVAGLAAQTSLVNVFAGIQLAFTDAIRVDDVVVVQKEWGRIEEITLTYVVVHIWDDRRMILPSTYFTTTPFENWTRRQSEVMGTVEFDLDWRAPVEDMRAELKRVLATTELWDKRVGILQITDATAGFVRVRILVSAADSATLFDLRCLIREDLVLFLQQEHPTALPHVRLESLGAVSLGSGTPGTAGSSAASGPASSTTSSAGAKQPGKVSAADEHSRHPADPHDSQLFTGSIEAIERSKAFTGPGEEVFEDRDKSIAAQN